MGKCNWCGKSGIFLVITANNLCNECDKIVIFDIKQRGRIINDCINLIGQSKNLQTRLSRCDLLLEHLRKLLEYEQKNIPTISPAPSAIIRTYLERREQIVDETTNENVEGLISNAGVMEEAKSKVKAGEKALLLIEEAKRELKDSSQLCDLEAKVKKFIYKSKLDGYLEEAKKAEFKGQRNKALDKLKEAMYLLKNDEISDELQNDQINAIETKIREIEQSK